MKKAIPVLICLLMITSCGLENLPPKSLTVKGNPGLYVPIGSPFAGMKEEDRLEYQLSPANMKKKMSENLTKEGADEKVQIFLASEGTVINLNAKLKELLINDMHIEPGVQTYVVHYPLMEMPLNLKKYADNAIAEAKKGRDGNIEIPANPGLPVGPDTPIFVSYDETAKRPELSNEDKNIPFVKIPFTKMAKLVKRVEGGKYGLEIDYTQELADNLWLKIPGFGINEYIKGKPNADNTKLQYYDQNDPGKTIFYPQRQDKSGITIPSDLSDDEGNLFVYAKITGPCSGNLTPQMIFEWAKALVDTKAMEEGKSTFMGDYPITNTLSEFVGKGVTFKKVIGFMYMSGVKTDTDASIIAKIFETNVFNNGNPIGEEKSKLERDLHSEETPVLPDTELPGGDKFDKNLYPMSITNNKPLDLTDIFESDKMTLQYAITINDMWYEHKDDDNDHIKFDMIVLIPMDMNISTQITDAGVSSQIKKDYVLLDFDQSFNETLWKGDLFGRKEGEENNIKQIEYFNVGIMKTNINIVETDKLELLAISEKESNKMRFKDNETLQLAGNSSSGPLLSPTFRLILKKDPGKDSGSFRILRPPVPAFDFKLYVEAKAKLEYTKNF